MTRCSLHQHVLKGLLHFLNGKKRAFCKKCKYHVYKQIRCPVCHNPRYRPTYCNPCSRGPHTTTVQKARFLMYKELKFPTVTQFPGEMWKLKDRIVHLTFEPVVLLKFHSDETSRFFIHCNLEKDFDQRIERLINLVSDCMEMRIHSGVKVFFLDTDVLKEYEESGAEIIKG